MAGASTTNKHNEFRLANEMNTMESAITSAGSEHQLKTINPCKMISKM